MNPENRPKLDPDNVPSELHPLIPYAEQWGVTDDVIRADVLEAASTEALRELLQVIRPYMNTLHQWLDAQYMERYRTGAVTTKESRAFLGLAIAVDEAKVILKVKFGEEHELL